MKILSNNGYINKIKDEGKKYFIEWFENVTGRVPKNSNVIDKIIPEQLERIDKDIQKWRSAVDLAEDLDSPDREELFQFYKDWIDDAQLYSGMQQRINFAITGTFNIIDEKGNIDEQEQLKFLDPKGLPLKWFRDFMRITMDAKFYGYEAIQLGDVVDDKFLWVKKVPEQNLIPYYDSMVKWVNYPYIPNGNDSVINFKEEPYVTWVITVGSNTDLGLINKCAPYIIYKSVFGSWAQHADMFGFPLRVGTTDMTDSERKQNMIDMFESQEGATWTIKDVKDQIDYISQQGGTDPHNIYGMLIEKCDQAISKIILSQTGTTDEKSFAGSAIVHQNVLENLIFSDKQDIANVINSELIPRMKKIGMIAKEKKIFGTWDFSENIKVKDWAEIISELSPFYVIPNDEVKKRIGLEVDTTNIPVPENKMTSIMKETQNYYKSLFNG